MNFVRLTHVLTNPFSTSKILSNRIVSIHTYFVKRQLCSKMFNENERSSVVDERNGSNDVLKQMSDKRCHLKTDVLVFSLAGSVKTPDLTVRAKDQLAYLLSADCYTVYDLDINNFMNDVWQDVTTCLCLVDFNETTESDIIRKLIVKKIMEFAEAGGRVLYVADADGQSPIREILLNRISNGKFKHCHTDSYKLFEFSDSGRILIPKHGRQLLHDPSLLNDILIQLSLTVTPHDPSSSNELTHLDMQCKSLHVLAADKQAALNFLKPLLMTPESNRGTFHNISFHLSGSSNTPSHVSDSECDNSVPLVIHEPDCDPVGDASRMDLRKYFSYLKTRELGRMIVHADAMESSFSAMESLLLKISRNCGLVISSAVQTKGRGRGSNKWISVLGTAMFTFHVTLSTSSYIGQHPSLVQHLASLAIVLACNKYCGENNMNFAVKWPNDVHLRNVGKVAGVLVTCSHFGDHQRFMIGCGINVSNSRPTVCLHGAINSGSASSGDEAPYLPSIEEVIAETLNQFESFLNAATDNKEGMEKIIRDYLNNWMHSDQIVRVSKEVSDMSKYSILDSNDMLLAKVLGIDHFGFLQVEHIDALNRRRVYSLHPDGNSFDMMRNLILPKD